MAHLLELRENSDAMRTINVRIIGIPNGVERERGLEGIFQQIIAENFPNLKKEISIPVQEAERTHRKK